MSVFTTRPIPFRPELVARIRSGHKTETRRLSGVEALTLRTRSEVRENGRSVRFADDGETFPEGSEPLREWTMWDVRLRTPRRGLVTSYSGAPVDVAAARQVIASQFCPLGTAGDGLWVKEPWQIATDRAGDLLAVIRYKDGGLQSVQMPPDRPMEPLLTFDRWRSPRFMPRWASRIDLDVEWSSLDNLQAITEAQSVAEGMLPNWVGDMAKFDPDYHGYIPFDADDEGNVPGCDCYDTFTARECFSRLWDQIHEAPEDQWAANPLVWSIGFNLRADRTVGAEGVGA